MKLESSLCGSLCFVRYTGVYFVHPSYTCFMSFLSPVFIALKSSQGVFFCLKAYLPSNFISFLLSLAPASEFI